MQHHPPVNTAVFGHLTSLRLMPEEDQSGISQEKETLLLCSRTVFIILPQPLRFILGPLEGLMNTL